MDVLVITSLYPPHSYGGYEATCRDVVERWRTGGHGVSVLTTDTRVPGVADVPVEQHVRRELSFYWVDHMLPDRSLRSRLRLERSNQAALSGALEQLQPQVVSVWSMGALSLGLLSAVASRGLPLVLVVCDDWLVYGERADLWRRPLAHRPALARLTELFTGVPSRWPPADAARGVYVSESVRTRADREAPWRPSGSTVVGSGIDLDDFPLWQQPDDRPWSWLVLQVGRIDPRKGLDVGLGALARLPGDATMTVLGRGDDAYLQQLRALAAGLGIESQVRFDSVPRERLASHYRQADVVLFLPTWEEPFGLVPLEAMASGTPVVTTATGGSASFLADGRNCLVVPNGDSAATAAAVRRLAHDAGLRRRLVEGGQTTAASHGVDAYADRLEAEHLAVLCT